MRVIPSTGAWRQGRKKGDNCKLLIHSDTTDGSTTFTGSSGEGHTVSVGAADVEHDTDQKKFGSSSILFDGDSGYLSIGDHADWNFGSGAFTIDLWVRFNNLPASSNYMGILQQQNTGDDSHRVQFYIYNDGSNYDITFISYQGAGSVISIRADGIVLSTGQWYHFAIIRGWASNPNDWAITLNGLAIATGTDSDSLEDLSDPFLIGYYNGASAWFDGWIDEVRIVKGTAMHTHGFWKPMMSYR